MHLELHPKIRQPPRGKTWHLVEAYFSLCGPLPPSPSYTMSCGVPLCVGGKKRDLSRKCDASTCSYTLFLFLLVSVACDCVCSGGVGPPLVGACCVLFVVVIPPTLHEAFVYTHPTPLKIETLFGNTAADVHVTRQRACDSLT